MSCSTCGKGLTYLDQFMQRAQPGYVQVRFTREHTHDMVRFYPNQSVYVPPQTADTFVAMGVAVFVN